jgi:tetratricopeptide (TPR) repeat protein
MTRVGDTENLAVDRVQTLDDLGQVLRRLRRRHARRSKSSELTVRELSRRSGYAYGVISEYLSGKALAPTDRFDVIIRLLGANAVEQRALATARDRVEEQRRAKRPAHPVPRELPPDVYGYTGRAGALTELDAMLRRGPGICVLAGTAGVGKTALAVHWAHRVAAEFPDGCLYVDLRGYDTEPPLTAAAALAGFLRSLGVDGADLPPAEAERAARFRTLLADRRLLVLLDNARDTDHVRALLPGGSGCFALVTSRDALTGLVARHGARRIVLDPLSPAEAMDLLALLLGDRVTADPDAAGSLAGRCAHLPLTLRLAAELAGTRRRATLAELDAELADVRNRLCRLDAGGEPRSACRAVFSWSYEHLADATARAFRLFGLYPGHDLDDYTMAALAGTDPAGGRSLLHDLRRAHLVQPVRPGRYGMHDLLRAYAAELAAADPPDERRAALARLTDQHLYGCSLAMDLIAAFDRDRRPKVVDPGWPVPVLEDADAATAWLDAERANLVATARHTVGGAHAGRLATTIVRYLDVGAHYQDAESLYRHVVDTGTPADRSNALVSLGIVCWRLGRYQDAAEHHELGLQIAREIGDDAAIGRALLGLGIVYWHLGRRTDTLHCGQEALDLYRDTGDRLGQARVLGNLGNVYAQLGDFDLSLDRHRQALGIFREIGDPAGTANELCGVGSMLETLGRFAEALRHLREGLALARRCGYRECEAVVLGNVGIVYRRTGRLDEAVACHLEALDLIRKIGDRENEGYALGYLGTAYEWLGDCALAVEHHRRALAIARELGDDHLAVEVLNRLGDAQLAWSRPRQALRSYGRALEKAVKVGERLEAGLAHRGLARTAAALGDPDATAEHWRLALAIFTRLGVPEADEARDALSCPASFVTRA